MKGMGDGEYRDFGEDTTAHLSNVWLTCGMKRQSFVDDGDSAWRVG